MTESNAPVMVAGGGLCGLAMALALAKEQIPVQLLDRGHPGAAQTLARDSRTSALALGSRHLLERLGVWRAIEKEACPILDIRVCDRHTPQYVHFDHRDAGSDPMGYIAENRVILHALWQAVSREDRITVHSGTTITGIEPGERHIAIATENGPEYKAKLLIAADGKNSSLRAWAGIKAQRHDYGQAAIICTLRHARPHHHVAHEIFLPAGPFAILPLPGNFSSIVWTEQKERAAWLTALPDAEFLEEIRRRTDDFLGELALEGPRAFYPLELVQAERYGHGRVALAGDAAHTIHPIAGQGFNLGLRDVSALTDLAAQRLKLGLDPGAEDLLASYHRGRQADCLSMIAATHSLNELFRNQLPGLGYLRRGGLAAVNRLPPLKRLFMRRAMGLETSLLHAFG